MAGTDNLKSLADRTTAEQREIAQAGGIASGEARRRKRDIRLALEALLEKDIQDKHGNTMSTAEAIALKQIEKALKGDTKAFEVVRDTAGQKPMDKVEVTGLDAEKAKLDELLKQRKERNAGKQ
jgi:hypothetical protein